MTSLDSKLDAPQSVVGLLETAEETFGPQFWAGLARGLWPSSMLVHTTALSHTGVLGLPKSAANTLTFLRFLEGVHPSPGGETVVCFW